MLSCVSRNFTEIYEEQVRTGHLHDDFMEGYGFKVDRNYDGDIIKRESTCEAWQRAKCLSSKYQRELRTRKVNVYHMSKSVKLAETQQNLTNMHTQNKKCITQLLSVVSNEVMPRPRERIPDISMFVMKNFSECNKDLLHGFIYVREFDNWKSNTTNGFKWPKNKEKLIDANQGSYNYIRLAYDVRSRLVILPITAEIGTITEAVDDNEKNDNLELEMPTVVEVQYT